jgi:fatty acid amide hydrolase
MADDRDAGSSPSTRPLFRETALALRERLASGELSSVALVEALYARTAEVDGRVRAYAKVLRDEALAEAALRDRERARGATRGALHGLPLTIKENIGVRGTDSTCGHKSRVGQPASEDAVMVRLLREAGAIVLGKGNVPQTLMAPESTNAVYGTTNNPWNAARVPGGSSGGEAALLASGQTPLAVGTDVGGSIRIPAAFCGVVGLKPTAGRWSNVGSRSILRGQPVVRPQMGPMARTVDDLALLFRAVEPRLMAALDPEVVPLALGDPEAVGVRGLRVGFYDDDGFVTAATSMKRGVHEAMAILERAGATLVPFSPPRAADVYFLGVAAFASDGLSHVREALAGEAIIKPLALFERTSRLPGPARRAAARALSLLGEGRLARALETARERSASELWDLFAERAELALVEQRAWDAVGLDAVLCPAYATPAPQHGATGDFSAGASYTLRYNVLNLPAGVVPVTRVDRKGETLRPFDRGDRVEKRAAKIEEGSEGLPVGVQVVARPYREDVVLSLMKAIEAGARAHALFPATPIDPL